jgi:Pretoxin HINT domain/Putative metal-binding motif
MRMHQFVLSTSAVAMGLGTTAGCTVILGLNNDYQEASNTGGGDSDATTTGSVNQTGHGGSTAMSSVSNASSNVTTTGGGGGTSTSGIGGSVGMGGAEATASASGSGGAGGGPLCITGTTRSCYTGPSGTQDKGACKSGTQTCVNNIWDNCKNEVTPNPFEVCNGIDDDCNGAIDDGNPGGGQVCSTGKLGVCSAGTTMCMSSAVTCKQNIQPSNEQCDDLDNDCNGIKDDGIVGSSCDTGQLGVCASGHQLCDNGFMFCEADNNPILEIQCNQLDDDCDGVVDECFVAGTNVYMADGSQRSIEQVRVGDWVVGYDLSTGSILVAPVVHTFIHPLHAQSRPIVRINESLRATTNHPFYANERWIKAEALTLGDSLLLLENSDGVNLGIRQVAVSSLIAESERETTYNIEVAGVHNYFAGGVLVHNKMVCPSRP